MIPKLTLTSAKKPRKYTRPKLAVLPAPFAIEIGPLRLSSETTPVISFLSISSVKDMVDRVRCAPAQSASTGPYCNSIRYLSSSGNTLGASPTWPIFRPWTSRTTGVTVRLCSLPALRIAMVTGTSGEFWITVTNCCQSVSGWPFTLVNRSPTCNPACSALPPGTNWPTSRVTCGPRGSIPRAMKGACSSLPSRTQSRSESCFSRRNPRSSRSISCTVSSPRWLIKL